MHPSLSYITGFEGTCEENQELFDEVFDPDFRNAETFTDQIDIICTYLKNKWIMVFFERIAEIFSKTRQFPTI